MIHYILEIIGFQLLFLMAYEVFLKKETFFTWNRIYLLVTPLVSLVLPFVKIPVLQQSIPDTYRIELPEILLGNTYQELLIRGEMLPEVVVSGDAPLDLFQILLSIWYVGIAVSLLVFVFKLYKIGQLERLGSKTYIDGMRVIIIPNSTTAFSFFNTMFLGENLSKKQQSGIVLHEAIHMREKHSLDMLFFEMQRILFWFNPLVYAYQKNMILLQEYMADAKVVAQLDKRNYYQNLLEQVFQTENISFINTFFNHSFIKKRIIMLQKSKSTPFARFKYVLLIPVVCAMLFYVACSEELPQESISDTESLESQITALRLELEAKKDDLTFDDLSELTALENQINKTIRKENTKSTSDETFYERESKYIDFDDAHAVPYAVIEKVPTYPGCSGSTNEELKKCMSDKIAKTVNRGFNTSLGQELGLTGVNRIFVSFMINKSGEIVNIRSRASHPGLEKEAERVIKTLPQMKPGEQNGEPVDVLYSLPITFKIQE